MEGVASEAASLAGHLRLGKLTLIYDDNHITIDGDTALAFSEDVRRRFEAYGWHVVQVGDGNDLAAIAAALEAARARDRPADADRPPDPHRRPRADQARHRRGPRRAARCRRGPPHQGDHGLAGRAQVLRSRRCPGALARGGRPRGDVEESEWRSALSRATPRTIPSSRGSSSGGSRGTLAEGWDRNLPVLTPANGQLATRQASGLALQATRGDGAESRRRLRRPGRQHRDDAQAGRNARPARPRADDPLGRARARDGRLRSTGSPRTAGCRPFGSTFLVFSDYMKPSIRLAAIMRLPVIYIGTHDSIGVGRGRTDPSAGRASGDAARDPQLVVLRPADATETVEAWRVAMQRQRWADGAGAEPAEAPGSRSLGVLAQGGWRAPRGAYVLLDPPGGNPAGDPDRHRRPRSTSRSPRPSCSQADRVRVRVVSMPSWELFAAQPEAYRERSTAALGARASGHRGGLRLRLAALDDRRRRHAGDERVRRFGPGRPSVRGIQASPPEHAADMVRRLLARRSA